MWAGIGGRGSGKTRALCEWGHERIMQHAEAEEKAGVHTIHRIGLGGRSSGDIRETIVEGESGMMAVSEKSTPFEANYEPSKKRISWWDGKTEMARASLFSAEEPDSARGPQYHTVMADEFAAWDFSITDDLGNNLWTNLMFGLRLPVEADPSITPQAALATTPKRIPELRDIVDAGLDPDDMTTQVTKMSSLDNAANLAKSYIDTIISKYEGTRMYQQEVLGILLDDDEDMLWRDKDIHLAERFLHRPDDLPSTTDKVVSIDPSMSGIRDECGIVAVGLFKSPLPGMRQKCVAVLADRSILGSSERWARTAIELAREIGTTRIIAENNQGFELVRDVIHNANPEGDMKVELVNSKDGKHTRAEPVAQIYEQQRVAHLQSFPLLNDELTMFIPGQKKSPNRLDALVQGVTVLLPKLHQRPATMGSPGDLRIARGRSAIERLAQMQAEASGDSTVNPLYLRNRRRSRIPTRGRR